MIDAFVRYHDKESCFICSREIDPNADARWSTNGLSRSGRQTMIHMVQVCPTCSDMEIHLANAKYEQNRYTAIGCGTVDFGSYEGDRCICGAVTHASLGFCVQCWKAHRMLDKAQAEARLIAKALTELRKQIKTNKQAISA